MAACQEVINVTFLVVGGGIAGVTCAETLILSCPNEKVMLLTESSVIKTVSNLEQVARYLIKFDVHERSLDDINSKILTLVDKLAFINSKQHWVRTAKMNVIRYRYLCLCTGGKPRIFTNDDPYDRVITIRDTDSVLELQRRLANARTVVLVGNGGIASELAYELTNVKIHWVVKDKHISATFVDPGAAHFFLQSRENKSNEKTEQPFALKRMRYSEMVPEGEPETTFSAVYTQVKCGAALGPDWHRSFELAGKNAEIGKSVPIVHYNSSITNFHMEHDRLVVTIADAYDESSNVKQLICDFIVSATGVDPRHSYDCDRPLSLAPDGGIAVDEMMATNVSNIYAAGDVCTASWEKAPYWFQMRLWTQARQMGAMAAKAMEGALKSQLVYQEFCFELFGHVTQLFGFPVILLGRFNGQGLGRDYEILLRTTKNKEYIKFVIKDGRLRGAILIGNTEMAETCENLILNGIDISPYGDDILNPEIDVEDYFD